MSDLLTQLMGIVASNPAAAAGAVGGIVVALFIWGVVQTSYRYR